MKTIKLLTWWQVALIRIGIFIAHVFLFVALIFACYAIWNRISEVKVQVEDNSTHVAPPGSFKIISEIHDEVSPHSEFIAQDIESGITYDYVVDRGHVVLTVVKPEG